VCSGFVGGTVREPYSAWNRYSGYHGARVGSYAESGYSLGRTRTPDGGTHEPLFRGWNERPLAIIMRGAGEDAAGSAGDGRWSSFMYVCVPEGHVKRHSRKRPGPYEGSIRSSSRTWLFANISRQVRGGTTRTSKEGRIV